MVEQVVAAAGAAWRGDGWARDKSRRVRPEAAGAGLSWS